MKTTGIPIWLTIVLGLLVLLSIASGGMAIIGNGMEDFMGASWGGRNLGLAAVSVVAISFRSPIVYLAAFISSIIRELGDIIQLLGAETMDWPVAIFAGVLIVVWAFGIKFANQARQDVQQ